MTAPVPVVAFVGHSKTGKTTLIERLIPVLTGRGFRVATVKRHHGDFDIDHPGKDSARHKQAGAAMSLIVSPRKLGLVEDLLRELTLDEILSRYVRDIDLCIVEGFKKAQVPKIEVYARKGETPPLALKDHSIKAIVTDDPVAATIPRFSRNSVGDIADFVQRLVFPPGISR